MVKCWDCIKGRHSICTGQDDEPPVGTGGPCECTHEDVVPQRKDEDMATKHTCNNGQGPAWGKKTPGCPRCDELINGAKPVQWRGSNRQRDDDQRAAEIRDHFRSTRHLSGGCGPVCTFGDW